MNFSRIFIERPVMTTLIVFAILLFGVVGYRALPVAALPSVEYPTIQVEASLPGADPETMASSVATPLEREFSTIAGIKQMSSSNAQGSAAITIQFDLSRKIDEAAQDIQAAISRAGGRLPPNMPRPPSYQKVNPAEQPIFYLALSSTTAPLYTIDEYAETLIAQRLSMVSGVSRVQVYGAQKYAVRVQVDPTQLAAQQVGIDDVQHAIEQSNSNLPTGKVEGDRQAFTIMSTGQLTKAAAYRRLIVTWRNGVPLRLEQLGRVIDDVENNKVASWYGGVRGIILAIEKQPGTNTVEVSNGIRELLPQLAHAIPPSIKMEVAFDSSGQIEHSINDVKFTLVLTVCLVVMVIFLFLRNVSATLIPSLALPASIVATFSVMYLLEYSLDNMSLMALTLCVGFVVDDAIVMLENIVRHMEMGKEPMRAAYDGSKEISFTIISMTISLVAVFIPVLFMGGIVGRLLHEFAVTISVAILVSGIVAVSLTPMLCSRFLKPPHSQKHGWFYNATERVFEAWLKLYDVTLRAAMRFHPLTMAVSIALLIGTVYLFTLVPKGFLPSEDQGRFNISTEAIQGISFDEMVKHQLKVADIVAQDPDVLAFSNNAGGGPRGGGLNTGQISVDLKPRAQRKRSVDQVIADLRPKLSQVPGIRVFLVNQPPINLGNQGPQRALYQFTLQDTDTEELYHWAPILEQKVREIPGIEDVSSDLQIKNPQIMVSMDRDKISALGLTVNQVETALYNAYGTRQVSQIYAPNNQYQVIMQVAPEFQRDAAAMSMLYVRSSSGNLIPLNTVATTKTDAGPLTVSHTGQLPSVTISFNLKPGFALGDAVTAIRQAAATNVPATMSTMFQGTAQAFQESLNGLGLILLMAIVVIYIVLGVLYESFTHPLTILSGLPSAGFARLLTLYLFKTELSLYAFVGIIMLVGLVKKNGIMMVDFAVEAQREHGKSPREAIHEACLVRFRPIMMTTMAALVGTLPIALGV